MPVSGNIGDTIQFQVTGANSVTGVKFGDGQANFSKISQTVLDAVVPQTASYGKVTFQKQNDIETFDITATGNGEAGAYDALSGVINTSGFFGTALSGCATGAVTFTDYNSASGVCVITATGNSLAQASGIVTSGHESGYCGGPTGFTIGEYTVSQTRLGSVTASALGGSDNFVAFATVEYTGNLNVKQASVTVTCNESGIQSQTTENFVPISRINSFTAVNSGGGDIQILGNALSSVSGIRLGTGINLNFTGASNTLINASIPVGNYEDFLYFDLYSGLLEISDTKYFTSGEVSGSDQTQQLFLFPNQKYTKNKGATDNIAIRGSGLSDLDSFKFVSKHAVEVFPVSFTGTSGQVITPVTGLETGLHDVVASKSGVSVTGENFVQILDNISHSFDYETFITSGIKYLGELSSGGFSSLLNTKNYQLLTTGDADRICLEFSGGNITAGGVAFDLTKDSNITQTVQSEYTIKGFGLSQSAATTNAYNKFNSGIYTQGLYGAYNPSTSYKVGPRVCNIISEVTGLITENNSFTSAGTYTGEVVGNPLLLPLITQLRNNNLASYSGYIATTDLSCQALDGGVTSGVIGSTSSGEAVTVSSSGYVAADNTAAINAMLDSTGAYSGYNLISTSTGIIDNLESYSFSSGISFPFPSSELTNLSFGNTWYAIHYSGMQQLYPAGWNGEHSLTSGFAIVTGSPTDSTSLTFSGQTVSAVNNLISGEINDNRSYCTTGDPSYFNTGEIVNLTETGYFYGYC